MCYRPIHIFNPSRKYHLDAPLKIAVPCGNCPSCQRLKQQEWFFRAFLEYQGIKDKGGTCYFITLTYDDEHLPWLKLPNGSMIPCFSGLHIRNFIKYFRIWLKRHGYPSCDIRYLVCSEFGDVTKRPHYHLLIYVPFKFNYWTDKIPIDKRFVVTNGKVHHYAPLEYALIQCWKHGFVMQSSKGWEIADIRGIRYASKYVVKDMSYYNLPALKDLDLYSEDFKAFKSLNYDSFPHHWQSIGFGEKFCDVIAKQSDIPQFLVRNMYRLANDSEYDFNIPRYYHIKFEREVDKVTSKLVDKVVTRPSDIGLMVKRIRLEQVVIKDVTNLRVLRDSLNSSQIDFDEFEKRFDYVNKSGKLSNLFNYYGASKDFRTLNVRLSALLNGVNLYRLSMYRNFLRFMPIDDDEIPEHKFEEVGDIISNMVMNNYEPPEFKDVVVPDGISEFALPIVDNPRLRKTKLCCHLKCFSDLERICYLLDCHTFASSILKEYDFRTKHLVQKKCKLIKGCKPVVYKSLNS